VLISVPETWFIFIFLFVKVVVCCCILSWKLIHHDIFSSWNLLHVYFCSLNFITRRSFIQETCILIYTIEKLFIFFFHRETCCMMIFSLGNYLKHWVFSTRNWFCSWNLIYLDICLPESFYTCLFCSET